MDPEFARAIRRGDPIIPNCFRCLQRRENQYWCGQCQRVYCHECWGQQDLHAADVRGSHEQTDVRVALIIEANLQPEMSSDEQEQLHQYDEMATWFEVVRVLGEAGENPVFMDFGRFGTAINAIVEVSGERPNSFFPQLVSFVGPTGAGKSTLIKFLVELLYEGQLEHPTPVVGALGNENCSTSEGVHLYGDPQTFASKFPILYADCEGLEAGEVDPKARTETKKTKGRRRAPHGSERPVTWAVTAELRSRQHIVTYLYPRILYTFSDVIVFVLKNGRTFEVVAERLLSWAAMASEKSYNQPVLPHAIIAINECSIKHPSEFWNVDFATESLFERFGTAVHLNEKFQPYAEYWRDRGKIISTLKDLLQMYYSSITVIHIPTNGRPNLLYRQIGELYNEIKRTCKASQERKQSLRMMLTAEQLHQYLQAAFDHFASKLDDPFDFVEFAFMKNPIVLDFGDNILKVATKAVSRGFAACDIFKELSYIVASCIMLDSARNHTCGTAVDIFPKYMDHCDKALEDFCDSKWPCEYKDRKGRCVNVKTGHTTSKGHQRKDGRILAVGPYRSSFSADAYRSTFRNMVYNNLAQLLEQLRLATNEGLSEERAAANIHKDQILRDFYRHLGGAHRFLSRSACFSCLMIPPEHPLPCGHVLCTLCFQAYSTALGKQLLELRECPLGPGEQLEAPCRVKLKPRLAGVRVLTLDGGGVRAIVELEILRLLEKELGGKIPLNALFDLIVGTNTGGVIALDLAVDNWGTQRRGDGPGSRRRRSMFVHFFFEIFNNNNKRAFADIPFISAIFRQSKYGTRRLEDELQRMFEKPETPLFGWSSDNSDQPKVAVISTSSIGQGVVISNYNRSCPDANVSYQFQRPEEGKELTVCEAARVTMTVPTMFHSFTHKPSKEIYVGGGLAFNNPVLVADLERKYIWPNTADSPLDIVLSVGSSYNRWKMNAMDSSRDNGGAALLDTYFPSNKRPGGGTDVLDAKKSSRHAQTTWKQYLRDTQTREEERYIRINPAVKCRLPNWDQPHTMMLLQEETLSRIRRHDIRSLAQRLIATCFYFENDLPLEDRGDGTFNCAGSIECRLTGANLEQLGEYFFHHDLPYFTIREHHQTGRPQISHKITSEIASTMVEQRLFSINPVNIVISEKVAYVEILMWFGEAGFPISGFPRPLQDVTRALRPRPNSLNSRHSSDTRREEWAGPPPRHTDTLTKYRDPDYVVGRTAMSFGVVELDSGEPAIGQRDLPAYPPRSRRKGHLDHQIPTSVSSSAAQDHKSRRTAYEQPVRNHHNAEQLTRPQNGDRPRRPPPREPDPNRALVNNISRTSPQALQDSSINSAPPTSRPRAPGPEEQRPNPRRTRNPPGMGNRVREERRSDPERQERISKAGKKETGFGGEMGWGRFVSH